MRLGCWGDWTPLTRKRIREGLKLSQSEGARAVPLLLGHRRAAPSENREGGQALWGPLTLGQHLPTAGSGPNSASQVRLPLLRTSDARCARSARRPVCQCVCRLLLQEWSGSEEHRGPVFHPVCLGRVNLDQQDPRPRDRTKAELCR